MHELADSKSHLHCRRCDSENHLFIKFKSPYNQPYYLCGACVEQEDKREFKFSPSWNRSRRPSSTLATNHGRSVTGLPDTRGKTALAPPSLSPFKRASKLE